MLTLQDIRAKYPQYEDLSDDALIDAFHKKYYADMPRDELRKKLMNTNFSIKQMVKNAPGSARQLAEDIVTPFIHPVQTYKSLDELTKGLEDKVVRNISGYMDPNFEHPPTTREGQVNVVGGLIKDRYGSVDALKSTLQNDPVGLLADVSAIVSGGASLIPKVGKLGLLADAAKTAGMAIDPINLAMNTAKVGLRQITPKGWSPFMYESAAKFRTAIPENERQKIVNTALDENLMPTLKGVNKAKSLVKGLGDQIGALLQDAEKAGTKIPRDEVFKYIKEVRDKARKGANPKTELAQINRFVKDLEDVWYNYQMGDFTPTELQSFKQDLYRITNYERQNTGASRATENARKATAKASKEELEAINPNIKPFNAREGDLLELLPELERSASRIENRDITSVGLPLKIGVGSSIGGPAGAAVGAGVGLLDMPRTKAKLAIAIANMKKMGISETMINNTYLPLLTRQLLMTGGRTTQGLFSE